MCEQHRTTNAKVTILHFTEVTTAKSDSVLLFNFSETARVVYSLLANDMLNNGK